MKKILLVLVVGLVVATAASYFGMQWRLKKAVDEAFDSIIFVDASYDDVSIDFNGHIVISGINFYVPANQFNIDIRSVRLETGGFWQALTLQKNFKDGKLPEQLKLSLQNFSMNFDPATVDAIDQVYVPDLNGQIMALGCGRHIALGPKELFDMGINGLTFDLDLGYKLDLPTDTLVSSVEFYLDGIGHLKIDQSYLGLGRLLDNYQSAMFGFDPNSVTALSWDMEYIDLGFNAKRRDYCAQSAGMEVNEWEQLNISMFAALLDQIGFDSNFDVIKLYSDVLSERSRTAVSLKPLPGFSLADLEFYDVSKIIELIDLEVRVNNSPLDINFVGWDADKLANLDLKQIRRDFRVGLEEEPGGDVVVEQESTQNRILKEVPVAELNKHLHRQVLLERKDGKTFTGELMSVTGSQIVVRTRFRTGYTDLPLNRQEVSVAKLYPE